MKKNLANKVGLTILILFCASGAVFAQNQWEFPVFFTVGQNDNVQVLNRTLQSWNEDFYTFIPSRGGLVIMETLGSIDTFMELYDAESGQLLSLDDNSGNSMNARIEFNVQVNRRYIIKVRGVGTWSTGNYGFRAYYGASGNTTGNIWNNPWNNPITYTIGQNANVAEINQSLSSGSEDFFLLVPSQNGIVFIETTGSTDTFMELYDADSGQLLDSDDDSGSNRNARIEYEMHTNRRYIVKVRGFGEWTTGSYGFKAYSDSFSALWNNPISYTIGQNANVPVVNRSIQSGVEDFFLLVPYGSGRLIIETTGGSDTFMELFDADTGQLLDSDDDSGTGYNARIEYNVQANRRYIAKVRGYGTWTTGNYSFRAYMTTNNGNALWANPANFTIGQNSNVAAVSRSLTSDSEDFFLLVPNRSGTVIAETTGNTDTFMELYDADTGQLLSSNDDGGSSLNARISYNMQAGRRYIAKVRGYSSRITGNYSFRAYFQ